MPGLAPRRGIFRMIKLIVDDGFPEHHTLSARAPVLLALSVRIIRAQ
jgi:hypothetical protein